MPTDVLLLGLTALLAVVAIAAAVVAVRASRRRSSVQAPTPAVQPDQVPRTVALVPFEQPTVARPDIPSKDLEPRHVEGRVVVPPTDQQVVSTAMSRPHVRLAIALHGLTYALRPESRDRISALMRREYRRRRRERLAEGRRAVRAARPTTTATWVEQSWIGELPAHSSRGVES